MSMSGVALAAPPAGPILADDKENSTPTTKQVRVEDFDMPKPEPMTYLKLGQDIPLPADSDELHVQCTRVSRLERLEEMPLLTKIKLIATSVRKIENLDHVGERIEHFELYQNEVKKMENMEALVNVMCLDLAFNNIRKIQCVSHMSKLRDLYLSSNKVAVFAPEIGELSHLRLLELGANKLREVDQEALGKLHNLEQLWLGKNKITSMALPPLPKLTMLSIQNNRLEGWDEALFENCPRLTHLYLSHNALPSVPEGSGLLGMRELTELDLTHNCLSAMPDWRAPVTAIDGGAIDGTGPPLEELWLNENQLKNLDEIEKLSPLGASLKCIYLEHNPLQGGDPLRCEPYRTKILEVLPDIHQIDALNTHNAPTINVRVRHWRDEGVRGIRKS